VSAAVPPAARRWAISFADLALLVACMLLLGWRPGAGEQASARASQTQQQIAINALFLTDEALFSAAGDQRWRAITRALPTTVRLRISVGTGSGGSARLDSWELAAARTAALARRLPGGVDVELAAPQPSSSDVILSQR
jgi:hypothetical protein